MGDDEKPAAKEKAAKSKDKKERSGRKHESIKKWEYYEVKDGVLTRKRKDCPRCGPGTFLSEHKNRSYCGRCGYTQLESKSHIAEQAKEQAHAEEKPAEEAPKTGEVTPAPEEKKEKEDS